MSHFTREGSLDKSLKRFFTGYGTGALTHNSLPDSMHLSMYKLDQKAPTSKDQLNFMNYLQNTKQQSIYTTRAGPEKAIFTLNATSKQAFNQSQESILASNVSRAEQARSSLAISDSVGPTASESAIVHMPCLKNSMYTSFQFIPSTTRRRSVLDVGDNSSILHGQSIDSTMSVGKKELVVFEKENWLDQATGTAHHLTLSLTANDNFKIQTKQLLTNHTLHKLLSMQNAKEVLAQFNFDA